MKTLFYLLTIVIAVSFLSCGKTNTEENITVLVRYKTQPNKNIDAVNALKTLMEKVEKEDHFVRISIYIDPADNSNILLHEEWENEEYYRNEHMNTEHLQLFMKNSQDFLAGPPEITYWRVNSVYK